MSEDKKKDLEVVSADFFPCTGFDPFGSPLLELEKRVPAIVHSLRNGRTKVLCPKNFEKDNYCHVSESNLGKCPYLKERPNY